MERERETVGGERFLTINNVEPNISITRKSAVLPAKDPSSSFLQNR